VFVTVCVTLGVFVAVCVSFIVALGVFVAVCVAFIVAFGVFVAAGVVGVSFLLHDNNAINTRTVVIRKSNVFFMMCLPVFILYFQV
jgi:hypothetical protein